MYANVLKRACQVRVDCAMMAPQQSGSLGKPRASSRRSPRGFARRQRPASCTQREKDFRAMFGFLRSRNDPLADARSAERWLMSGAPADSLARHELLLAELARVVAADAPFTPRRLAALFVIDRHAEQLFKSLATQYVEHAGRSAKIERQLWSALFDLTGAFIAAYQTYSRAALENESSARWRQLLPELTCRHIVHLGRDARVRLYHYESWIPGKWAELHALLSLATSRQLERIPVILARERPATTIEHQYLMVLLLQLMDTGNLTPRQIEELWDELGGWCATVRLSLTPKSPTTFFVDLASREGLRRRGTEALEGSVLFVDLHLLHALLMQNLVALEHAHRERSRSDESARRADRIGLLQRIAAKVDPEYKPFPRQGERIAANGGVDAIVGLPRIAGFLREEERDPDFLLYAGKSFGSSLELAVFGRVRHERDRRAELARHRLAQYAAAGGVWEVKDMSRTGFRLIAPMSAADTFPVGTLVAIRPQGETQWTLGIVRRMRRHTSERTEIGLQMVASTLSGVDLVEQRKSAEADYLVDGEEGVISGRSFVALFLTLKRREGEAGVQSLIVPAGEYRAGKRLTLVTAKSIYRVVLGGPIERQPEWVWSAVEPQEIGTTLDLSSTSGAQPARPQ
jgi:hypothetical protein